MNEENKIKEFRLELSKEYGFTNDADEAEMDFGKTEIDREQREKQEQMALIRLLDKDENARKLALEAGNKASNEALKLGTLTPGEIAEIAKQEMLKALKNYKPSTVTVERGVDKAAKIRDLFIEEENLKEGIFTHELEINDLVPLIRGKV